MHSFRLFIDKLMNRIMHSLTTIAVLLVFFVGIGLFFKAYPIIANHNIFQMLSSDQWYPHKDAFGFLPYIMGTVYVTAIAIVIAFPLCLLAAIYLSEYASSRIRKMIIPLIDL